LEPELPALDLGSLGHCLLEALEHAGIGVTIVVDRDGEMQLLFVNETAAATLGYKREEVMKQGPLLTLAPDDQERLDAMRREGHLPQQLDCTLIGKDGRRIPIEASLAVVDYEGQRASITFLSDISERKRVEAALRESEAGFKRLAEAAPDVIVVVDREHFLYANPAGVKAVKLHSQAEFLALHPSEFLPPSELETMQARMRRVAEGEQLAPRQYQGMRSDGSAILLEISSIPVVWEGRPAILAIGRDVTERVELQRQIAERDRLAAVGTLAAGIAHEVNNPLTYLMLHLEQLRATLPQLLGDAATGPLGHIDEALDGAERVNAIVRDLLELARPRAPRLEPTALASVCEAAARLVRPTLDDRAQISLRLDSRVHANTDGARLTQVLVNLLVNAAETGTADERTLVELSLVQHGDVAVVEVRDDGPGIPADLLQHVFVPFFTTKSPGTRSEALPGRNGGVGLGLSICHAIVTSLSGTIRAENAEPRGAVIRIELPSSARSDRVEAPTPSMRSVRTDGFRRVVIVDDEAAVATAVGSALLDVETRIFTSPRAALEALCAESLPYDVVLCDVAMPELGGEQLERELVRARPEYRGRFVFMTGAATPDTLQDRVHDGTAQVIKKPFGPEGLLAGLRANKRQRTGR
jgi:PAS domain S-box-containing protein